MLGTRATSARYRCPWCCLGGGDRGASRCHRRCRTATTPPARREVCPTDDRAERIAMRWPHSRGWYRSAGRGGTWRWGRVVASGARPPVRRRLQRRCLSTSPFSRGEERDKGGEAREVPRVRGEGPRSCPCARGSRGRRPPHRPSQMATAPVVERAMTADGRPWQRRRRRRVRQRRRRRWWRRHGGWRRRGWRRRHRQCRRRRPCGSRRRPGDARALCV